MARTGSLSPTSTGYETIQAPKYSPQKMQQRDQLRGLIEPGYLKGIEGLSKIAGGDQSYFDQLEAPAHRQFQALQGNIASRFSQSGSRHSSGFQNTMSAASGDFASQLQSQRMNYQQQALRDLMNIYEGVTDDPYDMYLQEKKKKDSWWKNALRAGVPVAGAIGGGFLGGPMGAVAAYTAGNSLASSLWDQNPQQADFRGIGNLPTKWSF